MSIEYLNNRIFESLISEYKSAKLKQNTKPKEFEKAEALLTEAFFTLSDNIAKAFKFQLVDIEDMRQEGVVICFEKLNRFDPNYIGTNGHKSKGFNYFTTCVLNHYRQLYRTAKQHKNLTDKYFEHLSKKVFNRNNCNEDSDKEESED